MATPDAFLLLFVCLKLCRKIGWSWVFVLAPFWLRCLVLGLAGSIEDFLAGSIAASGAVILGLRCDAFGSRRS